MNILRNFFLEIFIALRYLRGQGRTIIFSPGIRLSFFFMALFVYIMVLVLSVFNGFEYEINKLLKSSGYHITITRSNPENPIKNYQDILQAVEEDPALSPLVRSHFASISANALLEIKDRFEGKQIRAIPLRKGKTGAEAFADYPPLVHYNLEYLKKFQGGNYILVGRKLARRYNWKLGDKLRIFVPKGGRLSRGLQVNQGYFTIAGFFRTGFIEFDTSIIHMSLQSAQRMVGLKKSANELIVQVHDLSYLDQARSQVRRSMRRIGVEPELFSFSTIREERGNFLAAVKLEKTLMMIVMGLLIIAGVAGIWITVYLLVREKTQSIGMLRSMGLPMRSVNMIFTANAMLIGLLATVVGGSIGIFVTNRLESIIRLFEDLLNTSCNFVAGQCAPIRIIPDNIYYFDYLPVQADLNVIFGVALTTLILSGIAGYFPSRKAAALDPVDAMRLE